MTEQTKTIIRKEVIIEGEIDAGAGQLDIYGLVDGQIYVGSLIIHEGGKMIGKVHAESISVHGLLQGEVMVTGLLDIGETGTVNGDITYGSLAMVEGGELSAEVRNIPPTLAGDMKLTVSKGKAVRLTTDDLTAVDPDDEAKGLIFAVSEMKNGFVVSLDTPKTPAESFTQEELEQGTIVFVHDGKQNFSASFAVSVTDKAGASSGDPRMVEVDVRA